MAGESARSTLASFMIRVGRRLFRNTPIQRLQVVTRLYRFLFAFVTSPGQEITVEYLGLEFFVPTDDITIVPSLLDREYEREEFAALADVLRPSMTAVDVGANIGLHSLFFGSRVGPGGKVFAFEPEPDNCARLARNIARNRLENIEVFMNAAGAAAGATRLYLAEGSIGGHSASPEAGREAIDVAAVRLDDCLRGRVARIDIAKIDVEGSEPLAVAGFMETLTRDRPILLIEFAPELLRACGHAPEDLLSTLKSLYSDIVLFRGHGQPPVPLDESASRTLLSTFSGSCNLLCSPRSTGGSGSGPAAGLGDRGSTIPGTQSGDYSGPVSQF
jgi:FkbM family methyltransferase